ncbi:MAG: glucose-1-phosphate cytidylyltransferase [Planctomycetaceae bacterium]|nr:glucose-1-phosphate cytidylyltransferase [Planctomycetaceae bacterium]
MHVAILAGGMGTRLQEETSTRPKPMVEIGGHPILWHIMKHFAHHDQKSFFVACGYMGDFIKNYFLDQYNLRGNLRIDFANGSVQREKVDNEDWVINMIDTGLMTNTGGRIRRLKPWLQDEPFLVTYGDGVSDVDIPKLIAFHKQQGKIATVSAVRPPARFGGLVIDGPRVTRFTEKPVSGEGWINGGFMVLEPAIFDYLDSDSCSLEADALERVAADGQLNAFRHDGFWHCMDTLRDRQSLQKMWEMNQAPWKTWDQSPGPRLRVVPERRVA